MELDYAQISFYITGLIGLLLVAGLGYVFKELRELRQLGVDYVKEKAPLVYDIFERIVRSGVLEAELEWFKGEVENKKEFAIKRIKQELEKYGLDKFFNIEEISRQIEIAVYDEFNKKLTQ